MKICLLLLSFKAYDQNYSDLLFPHPSPYFFTDQIGDSGRSTRELEKTIALLKKVVERTQMENEQLKKAPGVISNEQLKLLQNENQGLKVTD